MLRLRPFKNGDAGIITSWIRDERAFRLWSADRYESYPIVPADMINMYSGTADDDTFFAFTAYDEDGIVGHITMRFPTEKKDIVRLGFVIVDDTKRGQGLGKQLVNLAVKYATEFLGADKVSLGVFENNESAYKCYKACGFETVILPQTEVYKINGEEWPCIEMEKYVR